MRVEGCRGGGGRGLLVFCLVVGVKTMHRGHISEWWPFNVSRDRIVVGYGWVGGWGGGVRVYIRVNYH